MLKVRKFEVNWVNFMIFQNPTTGLDLDSILKFIQNLQSKVELHYIVVQCNQKETRWSRLLSVILK